MLRSVNTRQPSTPLPVRRDGVGQGLIICPQLSIGGPRFMYDSALRHSPVTITGSPTAGASVITPKGYARQFHPSSPSIGATSAQWPLGFDSDAGDWTVIWAGYPDNVSSSNGYLVQRGSDVGGSDSVRLHYTASTTLQLSVIDSTPAERDLSMTVPAVTTGTSYQAVAGVKRGNGYFLYDLASSQAVVLAPVGSSTMRAAANCSWALAGVAGHNHAVFFGVWSYALPAYVIWSLLRNPWQVYPDVVVPVPLGLLPAGGFFARDYYDMIGKAA